MDEHIVTWISQRFDRLEKKIDALQEWKWKLTGAVMVIAFITSAIVAYVK